MTAAAAVPPAAPCSVPESGSSVAPEVALESVLADCPALPDSPFRHPDAPSPTAAAATIAPTLRIRIVTSSTHRSPTSSADASPSTSRSLRYDSSAAASSIGTQRDSATSWSWSATSPRSYSNRKK